MTAQMGAAGIDLGEFEEAPVEEAVAVVEEEAPAAEAAETEKPAAEAEGETKAAEAQAAEG